MGGNELKPQTHRKYRVVQFAIELFVLPPHLGLMKLFASHGTGHEMLVMCFFCGKDEGVFNSAG